MHIPVNRNVALDVALTCMYRLPEWSWCSASLSGHGAPPP